MAPINNERVKTAAVRTFRFWLAFAGFFGRDVGALNTEHICAHAAASSRTRYTIR